MNTFKRPILRGLVAGVLALSLVGIPFVSADGLKPAIPLGQIGSVTLNNAVCWVSAGFVKDCGVVAGGGMDADDVATFTNKTFDADGTGNSITNIENADIKAAAAIAATKIADGTVTSAEFQFINTLTSNAQTQIDAKATLASPALTGTPTAPTASPGTNTTQIATTAYADAIAALKSNLASPTFTGVPAAPTASPGTNTTQIATTAYADAIAALKANLASPALTGTPTAPTASPGNNTTQIATTAYADAIAALKANLAAPTFTGDAKAVTASALDNDTSIATTQYVQTELGGKMNASLIQVQTAAANATDNNSVQSWFPAAGDDAVAVEASTIYRMVGHLHECSSTTTTGHNIGLSFAGSATLNFISYQSAGKSHTQDAIASATNFGMSLIGIATNVNVWPATSTLACATVVVNGIVSIANAGTFIPQFTFSAAPGLTPQIMAGTFFSLTKITDPTGTWN